jgi:hypothetical protein
VDLGRAALRSHQSPSNGMNEDGPPAGRGHSPWTTQKGVPGLPHFLHCPRCGYTRPLDTRALLSRQTTCPTCELPSRLELTIGPTAATAVAREGASSLPSQTNHSL